MKFSCICVWLFAAAALTQFSVSAGPYGAPPLEFFAINRIVKYEAQDLPRMCIYKIVEHCLAPISVGQLNLALETKISELDQIDWAPRLSLPEYKHKDNFDKNMIKHNAEHRELRKVAEKAEIECLLRFISLWRNEEAGWCNFPTSVQEDILCRINQAARMSIWHLNQLGSCSSDSLKACYAIYPSDFDITGSFFNVPVKNPMPLIIHYLQKECGFKESRLKSLGLVG